MTPDFIKNNYLTEFSHSDGVTRVYVVRNRSNGHQYPVRVKTLRLGMFGMADMYNFHCLCPRQEKPCQHVFATYLADAEKMNYTPNLEEFQRFVAKKGI